MIVCSCNQLTDRQVLDSLTGEVATRPRSPGQVYLCLGCKPNCGRCVQQIRQMFSDITSSAACQIGCAVCPGEAAHSQMTQAQVAPAEVASAEVARAEVAPASSHAAPDWRLGGVAPRRQLVVPEAQRFCASRACAATCGDHSHDQAARPANDDAGLTLMAAE